MEGHHRLASDPRIMEPLEELLRTIREVVESPRLKEEAVKKATIVSLFPKKKARSFNRWW